jgi:hypothetical protein
MASKKNSGQGLAPYGIRHAENVDDPIEAKGKGYYGKIPAGFSNSAERKGRDKYSLIPDSATEISASDSKGNSYPLIVPGLSKDELKHLASGKEPTDKMYEKAEKHAAKRKAEGKSPFADDSELRYPKPEMKKGGVVKSASQRADGIAQRGRTKGRVR